MYSVQPLLSLVATIPDNLVAGMVVLLPIVCCLLLFFWWRSGHWKHRCVHGDSRIAILEERLAAEREHSLEKIELLERAGAELRHQFKSLAQDIFDEKSRKFSELNSERIDSLLQPFKEQLGDFKTTVEQVYLEETREHASLRQEILHLRDLNRRINEEAANLARAIAGDRKLQGTWGELVLERLLEQSGLRRGHDYDIQSGLRDHDNRLFKPDVIIHLPRERDIVIDSKVSLSAWTRFVAAPDDATRARAMTEHLDALRTHLKQLAAKDYSSLTGLRSLDFVLMFVPIDTAFIAAIQADESLIAEMHGRKILIVTPTTLLATLRTIEHFWQTERQNRNAVEIARRAGALYDKLASFLDDLERLGRQLDGCRDTYDKAMIKISQGRGNLLSQVGAFPELGVKVKTELSKTITERQETAVSPEDRQLR